MNEKLFALTIGLGMIVILSACGSTAGAQAPGSESNSQPNSMQAEAPNPQASPEVEVQPIPTELAPEDSHIVTLESGSSMRVLWKISDYVIGADASWSPEEAEAMLFKPLDVTDTQIIFDSRACQGVTFQRENVSAAEFLSETWKTTPQELGIEVQDIQVTHTNCSLPGFQEYVRLPDRRLIVPINGVFFFFEPAVSY